MYFAEHRVEEEWHYSEKKKEKKSLKQNTFRTPCNISFWTDSQKHVFFVCKNLFANINKTCVVCWFNKGVKNEQLKKKERILVCWYESDNM